MKYPALLILLLLANLCRAQDLSGKWLGEMPQVTSSLKYKMEMEMTQKGDSLFGSIRYTAAQYWVVQNFKGAIKGRSVTLDEYSVTGCNCVNGVKFCLKNMKGELSINADQTFLVIDGNWTSASYYDGKGYVKGACAPGRFMLAKQIIKPISPQPVVELVVPATPPPNKPQVYRVPDLNPIPKGRRPRDGYFDLAAVPASKVTPHANLREADVTFMKRIWRDIDIREKFNNYLASPKARLIDLILDAVVREQMQAYDTEPSADDPGGDAFSKPLTAAQAFAKLSDSSVVSVRDANNNIISNKLQANQINPDSIVRFRIKEDWIFDKQRSVMEPRIIGIAPMYKPKGAGGYLDDYVPAFWIYFPEARKVFAAKPIAVEHNDATGLSFDDAFIKRLFTSFIIKISNNKDERIKDYAQGIDRLYEAQRIKKDLMDWELDLWQY